MTNGWLLDVLKQSVSVNQHYILWKHNSYRLIGRLKIDHPIAHVRDLWLEYSRHWTLLINENRITFSNAIIYRSWLLLIVQVQVLEYSRIPRKRGSGRRQDKRSLWPTRWYTYKISALELKRVRQGSCPLTSVQMWAQWPVSVAVLSDVLDVWAWSAVAYIMSESLRNLSSLQ